MANISSNDDCGLRFFCENYIDNAVITVTSGAENIQFPKDNLKDPSTMKYFRSESNETVLVLDLQHTSTLNAFAVLGNTNRTFGFTAMSFKTSLTSDFSQATSIPVELDIEQNMGYVFFDDVSHRFVEITITGTGSYIEVGRILIGEHFHLQYNNLAIGSFSYGYNDLSDVSSNRYGQKFIDERPMMKRISGSIQYCIKEEMDVLDNLFITKGKHEPVFMVMDAGGSSFFNSEHKTSIYGYFKETPSWSADGGHLYSCSINLEEVV